MPAVKTTNKRPVKSTKTTTSKLRKKKKISWKFALPVILVVAAVGGFVVYKSFASSQRQTANGSWSLGDGKCKLKFTSYTSNSSTSGSISVNALLSGYCGEKYRIREVSTRYSVIKNGRSLGDKVYKSGNANYTISDLGWGNNLYYQYSNIDILEYQNGRCAKRIRYLSKRNTSGKPVAMTKVGTYGCPF